MKFKDLNIADKLFMRYTRMEDGGYQHCMTAEDMDALQAFLDDALQHTKQDQPKEPEL